MLARLAGLFTRLAEAATFRPCPSCSGPLALREETPMEDGPFALRQVYECERCSRRVVRCSLWSIPD